MHVTQQLKTFLGLELLTFHEKKKKKKKKNHKREKERSTVCSSSGLQAAKFASIDLVRLEQFERSLIIINGKRKHD